MDIQIDERYRLVSDGERNLILQKKNKKGKYLVVGYFGNLESALKSYIEKKQLDSTATSVKELLNEIRELRQYVKKIMGDL